MSLVFVQFFAVEQTVFQSRKSCEFDLSLLVSGRECLVCCPSFMSEEEKRKVRIKGGYKVTSHTDYLCLILKASLFIVAGRNAAIISWFVVYIIYQPHSH